MVNYLPIPVVRFFILRRSNQSGQGLILIVSRKVVPILQGLWCMLRVLRARYQSFVPLFSWVRGYILRLRRHPRSEAIPSSHPPSSRPWWTCYGLVIFQQESSYEAFPRAILQQTFSTTFLSYLNRLRTVRYQGSWATRGFHLLVGARLQLNSSSITVIFYACITIRSSQSNPLRRCFLETGFILLGILQPAFLGHIREHWGRARYCCIVTMGIHFNPRSQCGTKRKRKTPSPATQALANQIKNACVTITIFCIFVACFFNQIRK